jgi:hypothetical protein
MSPHSRRAFTPRQHTSARGGPRAGLNAKVSVEAGFLAARFALAGGTMRVLAN